MTISRDLKFAFKVEIDGISRAAFKSCSDLSTEVGEVSIREGGVLLKHKEAGLVEIPDITLERGKSADRELYDWINEVIDMTTGRGQVSGTTYKRNLDIVQLDRNGDEKQRHRVFGAWPKTRTIGEWDNDTEEFVMETLVLACDYYVEL